jgi:hypothetical protein
MPDEVRGLLNDLQLGIGDFLRDPEPRPEALVALFTEMRTKARELLAEAGVPAHQQVNLNPADIAVGAVDRLCDYDAWEAPGEFAATADRIADFLGVFVRTAAVRLAGIGVTDNAAGEEAEVEFRDLKEGDRLRLPGEREGTVVAGPDSEGKFPVAIDGDSGGPVIFTPDEVELCEKAAPAAAPATDGEGQGAEPTPLRFTEGDRVETRDGRKGTIAATPDPGKLFPVLIDGTEVPEAFAEQDLNEEVPF